MTSKPHNPGRTGILADTLLRMLYELDHNPKLQQILGVPVVGKLALIADENDLRIEATVELTDEQAKVFLDVLDTVVQANAF